MASRIRSCFTALKTTLIGLALALHTFFVLSVVTHLHDWLSQRPQFQPITALTEFYSAITFTNRNFGFFAPTVNSDWNLRILATDDDGKRFLYSLPTPNREMRVKLYAMLGQFNQNDNTMDLFARSWAVYVMNHSPRVVRVDILVTQNHLPTMAEYRAGKRISEYPVYRTTFELRSSGAVHAAVNT